MKHILIIGTGLSGYLFAKEFRKHDTTSSLTMVTKSDGYFYSKPLLSTALSNKKTPSELTINTVETMRTQLNATIFIRSDIYQIDAVNKKIFFYDEKNQEKKVSYDKLIVANGANTINIPLEGDAVDDVLHVNQLEDYRIFRDKLSDKKRVAILGAGLVGCEFANDLISAGYDVTMIAPDDYLLKKWVPEKVGRALETVLRQAGVHFHLSVFPKIVQRSSVNDSVYEIILSDGAKLQADVILSAAGIKPNLSLATMANLKTNLGICVNEYLQTSDPDVYALGDCAEMNGDLKMVVAAIMQNSRVLAEVLAGKVPVIQNQIIPVAIKTGLCPIVVVPPDKSMSGEWKVIAEDANIQALFYDHTNQLRGFALSGNGVKERMRLIREMSA